MAGIDKAITVLFLIASGAVVSIVLSLALFLITDKEGYGQAAMIGLIILVLSMLGILLMYMFQAVFMIFASKWGK